MAFCNVFSVLHLFIYLLSRRLAHLIRHIIYQQDLLLINEYHRPLLNFILVHNNIVTSQVHYHLLLIKRIFYQIYTMVNLNPLMKEKNKKKQRKLMALSSFFVCSANDIDQSSGRGEKQHEETEQEHHMGRIKPYYACCSFCVVIIFCCIPVVQNFTEIGCEQQAFCQ